MRQKVAKKLDSLILDIPYEIEALPARLRGSKESRYRKSLWNSLNWIEKTKLRKRAGL